ncbi:hypothetical protein [Microlunatus sp. GCM10028923]|uniref:YobI family P-loop NTPase n=1 Tax=Microlunatus sp. GCM10028923 TaxID=3273400 RepID=UPI0036165923
MSVESGNTRSESQRSVPELESLQPRFDRDSHQSYVDLLFAAIDDDGNRNIALSGQYGSGKSSILAGFKSQLSATRPQTKVIQLTLSTLNSDTAKKEAVAQEYGSDHGHKGSTHAVTRALEREIVKQLLYRETPTRMPGSRFRRTAAPDDETTASWAILAAAVTVLIGIGPVTQNYWWTLAGGALAALLAAVWVVRRNGAGLSLKQIGAAGASLHLDDSRAYFDDHLDEIIYFFQVSKTQVVIFEDIDRFDNLSIFESLRELNILLNETEQLERQRPIRFVYATRDSIFKHAAREATPSSSSDTEPSEPAQTDGLIAHRAGGPESVGSSRTKFFDVVIPVLPFATRRTSREHLTRAVGNDVDANLIDLVAREVTDMRLILNIGNEFRVFRPMILRDDFDIEILTPTGLFAMIVYKNLYPEQFEKVSTGTSELDQVYDEYRKIVNSTARDLEQRATQGPLHPALVEAARRLKETASLINSTSLQAPNGQQYPETSWEAYDFWSALAASGPQSTSYFLTRQGQTAAFTNTRLSELIDQPLTSDTVKEMEVESGEGASRETEEARTKIIGASIQNLMDTDRELINHDGAPVDFRDLVRHKINDSLVFDMINHGYIDRNFSLYASAHDPAVRPSALRFVLAVVEPNKPDPRFQFDDPESDIPSVLREAGEAFLSDRRAFNVQILDHLILHQRPEVDALARLVGEGTAADQEFLDAVIAESKHAADFTQAVSRHWADIFTHLINDRTEPAQDLVDAAVRGATKSVAYTTSHTVSDWIDTNGAHLASLSDASPNAPDGPTIAAVLEKLQVPVSDMRTYSTALQNALFEQHHWAVTKANLAIDQLFGKFPSLDEVISQLPAVDDAVALDPLQVAVRDHVLQNLAIYLPLCQKENRPVIDSLDQYEAVLRCVGDLPDLPSQFRPEQLEELVDGAPDSAQIDRLDGIPKSLWRALAHTGRAAASVANLHAYLQEMADLDAWSEHLDDDPSRLEADPDDSEETRTAVASAILAMTVQSDTCIKLLTTLKLRSPIDPSKVPDGKINIIPDLVEAGLMDDSLTAFRRSRSDAQVARRYIAIATQISSYLAELTDLSAGELTALADDGDQAAVRVLLDAPALLARCDETAASKITKRAQQIERVPYDTLTVLARHCCQDPQPFVELFAKQSPNLAPQQAQALLDQMPDPYLHLGKEQVEVPLWTLGLLDSLERHGIIGRSRKKRNGDVYAVQPAG